MRRRCYRPCPRRNTLKYCDQVVDMVIPAEQALGPVASTFREPLTQVRVCVELAQSGNQVAGRKRAKIKRGVAADFAIDRVVGRNDG